MLYEVVLNFEGSKEEMQDFVDSIAKECTSRNTQGWSVNGYEVNERPKFLAA